jgi:hypothetical protein
MGLRPGGVELRPEIAQGRFRREDVAVPFYKILEGRAPAPYDSPERFFEITHLTDALRAVLVRVLDRVAGRGGDKVLIIRSGFGGGKTHVLATLYYLFTRREAVRGQVEEVVRQYGSPQATVCALDASAVSPFRTPLWTWLGGCLGADLRGDEVPETKALEEALRRSPLPVVILIDEIGEYFRQIEQRPLPQEQKNALAEGVILFFRRLCDALRERDVLVIALPDESAPFSHWVHERVGRLREVLRRVGVEHVPITRLEEVYGIVRRRLFARVDEALAERVAGTYSQYYSKWREWFVEEWTRPEELKKAYPFHPAFMRTLWERVSSIPDFQRTRDLIYTLALVAHHVIARQGRLDDLILPGDVDFSMDDFKKFFTTGVGRPHYLPIIEHDLRAARELEGHHYYLAAGLYLYSLFGGDVRKNAADVKIAITLAAKPRGGDPEIYRQALEELLDRLWYLSEEGGRYWFSAEPNVNKMLEERRAAVLADEAYQILEEEAERLMRAIDLPFQKEFAYSVNDIRDERRFRLYVWHPRAQPPDEAELRRALERLAYRNSVVVLLHSGMPVELAKYVKACEALREELKEPSQRQRLESLCEKRALELYYALYRSYNRLAVPAPHGVALRELRVELAGGESPSKAAAKFREAVARAVRRALEEVEKYNPPRDKFPEFLYDVYLSNRLRNVGYVNIADIREDFYRDPDLPMVEPGRALIDALVKLAEEGKVVLSCGNSWYWPQGLRELEGLPESEEVARLRELLDCDPDLAISVVKEVPREVAELLERAKRRARPTATTPTAVRCEDVERPLAEGAGVQARSLVVAGDPMAAWRFLLQLESLGYLRPVDASAEASFKDGAVEAAWRAKGVSGVKKLLEHLITLTAVSGEATTTATLTLREGEVPQEAAELARAFKNLDIKVRGAVCRGA